MSLKRPAVSALGVSSKRKFDDNDDLSDEVSDVDVIPFAEQSDEEEEADLEELVFGTRKKVEGEEEQKTGFFIDKTSSNAGEKSRAVWVDDDDEEEAGIAVGNLKARGMGNMIFQPLIRGGRKNEFEKAIGAAPSWSVLPESKEEMDKEDEDKLLTSSFKYIADSDRLPKTIIDFHRCADANKQQPSKKRLEACEFHKSAQIALTASNDCRLSLFQVDGKCNPKIHSFFMERFPIKCAHFLLSGEEIVMTSQYHWFYSYDLISGNVTKIPHIRGTDDKKVQRFVVSPDKKHLLFLSNFGHIHLMSAKTKELIRTVKVNGLVRDVAFRNSGEQFLVFGDEGVVTIWDIRSHNCMHSFTDEGCTHGSSLAVSSSGKRVACGSASGIVNLYDENCFTVCNPKPIKMFKNLQCEVNSLRFNSTSEILAMASSVVENSVKLVHVPSLTVFSNFPGLKNLYLKYVRRIDFSPNSGYFVVGNSAGRAPMFRLDHFKSY